MTKAKSNAPRGAPVLNRKHLARAERERRLRRGLIGVALGIFVVTAGLVAYPLIDRSFLQPGQPVAIVNGTTITTRDFQKRARFTRVQLINQYWNMQQLAIYFGQDPQFQSQMASVTSSLNSPFGLGRDVLDALIKDVLMRQEAERRGISVSQEEMDARFRELFRFFPDGTPTPEPTLTLEPSLTPAPTLTGQPSPTVTLEPSATPTEAPSATPTAEPTGTTGPAPTGTPEPTITPVPSITPTPTPYTGNLYDRDYFDYIRSFQRQAGMTEADVRAVFESELLRDKLIEVWEATPEAGSVHARHILVADEATANEVIEKLEAGEDFVALAAEYSTDPTNKDSGGDLGFFGRGEMVSEFDAAAFENPVGLVPEPVQTSFGWHVIEILETRDEPLAEAQERAFNEWLQQQRDDPNQVTTFDYWEERVPEDPRFDPGVPPVLPATSTAIPNP